MDVATLGWICAAVGALSSLPQVVRLVRAGTSDGVSLLNWQLVLGSTIGWVFHGTRPVHGNIILTNALVGLGALALVVMICRDRHLGLARQLLLVPLLVAAVCIGTDVGFGPAVFGTIVMLPQAFGQVAQLKDLLTSPDIEGVSIGFMLVNLSVQLLWLVWSLLAHDSAVMVAGGTMAVLVTLNILAWAGRRVLRRRR